MAEWSGIARFARPYRMKDFHLQSLADLSRRTGCPVIFYRTKIKALAKLFFIGPVAKGTLLPLDGPGAHMC